MSVTAALAPLRAHAGQRRTSGLDDATIGRLADSHPDLVAAIDAAAAEYARIKGDFADLLDLDEDAQVAATQSGYVNFYPTDAVNPYVALTARGPWIVTLKGAVVHDSGGYGMLGLGHAPQAVIEAMAKPQAMANVMTPSLSQLRFERAMRKEIGHTAGG
ncbi:MAG TPA: lysine 6-aminotransferase, partial [Luteimonas sp.]|nr:lysine 6-aminotransferase [Luteimonas sp.]